MKVDITHLAMETDFQTSDHAVAMEKEAEQQNALNAVLYKLQVVYSAVRISK